MPRARIRCILMMMTFITQGMMMTFITQGGEGRGREGYSRHQGLITSPFFFSREKKKFLSSFLFLYRTMSGLAALGFFLTLQVVGTPAMPSTECARNIQVATWWCCTYSRSTFCVLRGGSGPAEKIAEIEKEMRVTQKNKVRLS